MIGYFNAKKQSEDEYLLTNDMGFYKYVNSETYDKLCNNKIDKEDEDYEDLIEKGFIVNISIEEYIKKYSGFIRSICQISKRKSLRIYFWKEEYD